MVKTPATLRIRETISAEKVGVAIATLVEEIGSRFDFRRGDVAIVGVHTRGAAIAERVAQALREKTRAEVPVGAIDITFYRDDLGSAGLQPVVGETTLNFDVDDKTIVLIDDVLFTGRTVRAAIDEILDFGRPKKIVLAVLVDRGHRELPIAPDITALRIETKPTELVVLSLTETDGKEEIVIGEKRP